MIWAVIHILDMQLLKTIQASTPQFSLGATLMGAGMLSNVLLRAVVDMIILSLYLGLPFFFMSMLAWAGERNAAAGNQATTQMGSGAKDAGSKGTG